MLFRSSYKINKLLFYFRVHNNQGLVVSFKTCKINLRQTSPDLCFPIFWKNSMEILMKIDMYYQGPHPKVRNI